MNQLSSRFPLSVALAALLAVLSVDPAVAASLITTEQITAATTDALDTAEALGQGFLVIAAGITVAMALPGMLRRVFSKSGVR